MPDPFLAIDAISKTYPGADRPSVADATVLLEKGKMLALLGPSGCGKTTLLRIIAGLVAPDEGRIEVAGRDLHDVPLHRRGMGMVFQSYALFPHLSVARNIAFGLEVQGVAPAERARRVADMLALTKLGAYADRKISALSGGQQQRVALARSLAIEPSILLLDEPLANLDVKLREVMRAEIRNIQTTLGLTTIFVTHDQAEALSTADLIAVMNEGRIVQIGTPQEIYDRPATRFVADFVGRCNFLTLHAEGGDTRLEGYGPLGLGTGTPTGAGVLLVRPHRLHLRNAAMADLTCDVRLDGRIAEIVFSGEMVTLRVAAGDLILSVERPSFSRDDFALGQPVELGWNWADVALLDDKA